ncbi:MAG: pyrroloquinoline quinone biosynthesis peptide chaperone PqqD [Methylotenera sp.]|jgi:pyrroloquinoline quinone biosynthesis protein D|uniref:pyrroloquinoline quinone biosynthesis peptide chaperone PqqD n=1 Tax=Methylotenera sp. TaxID=2051956 RepID=UPI002719F16D|nr:pyrroloquinoline quinone biosynthesis peptide chaperone PqqD [Methylotenera sp.]MDO9150716.1 pyrroloquinoline quinone biosynthesis peptide chaperone PqqD [Methylotenera sp.]
MMDNQIQNADIYTLSPHHRFQWEEAQSSYVILFPEGMVKLHGGAGEVIKRLDGKATVGDVVADLKATFPDAENIEKDIIGMYELALSKTWIRKV